MRARQRIRFCTAGDGVRIAYAASGSGPALVKAANWLTHLEFDWDSPIWRHWIEGLGRDHELVRYDERASGLSDPDARDLSLDAQISDFEAVVDAAGLERFAVLGISQGGAIAIAYAVRHPERVSALVLHGSYARGRGRREQSPAVAEENELLLSLIRVGWGRADARFRRVFTSTFIPGASEQQMTWFDELQRVSASPENAGRLQRSWMEIDVVDLLDEVACPTLVAHARGDQVVPFEEGRILATGIPGATFLPLESENHLLLADEPAWETFLVAAREHLRSAHGEARVPGPKLDELSEREREVLALVAEGLSNEEIGERLYVSVRTVERHLSNVYAKLGVSGKAGRAAAAARFSQRS
ncbi:MAG TPA: alpha/beta fold hydrolase [Solirubrobacterales bacterium]|nr:alpha/beta fold hydrolase [Solirubrobacterales bacterium]